MNDGKYTFDFWGVSFGINEYDNLKKHFEEKYPGRIPDDYYEELFNIALANEASDFVKKSQEEQKKLTTLQKRKITLEKNKKKNPKKD